jgi:polyphosphate kinase 2 (PPK2 family)
MQLKRFHPRRHDPRKTWKLSPMDIASLDKWGDYTDKRDRMLEKTHSASAPWVVARANDKERAHVNVIRHLLHALDYDGRDKKAIGAVDGSIIGSAASLLKK